jgi:hypothetical protein
MEAVFDRARRRSGRIPLLALVVCLMLAAIGGSAQSASASVSFSESWFLGAYTWGPWTDFHAEGGATTRTQYMRADYNGSGTVPVCEQTYGQSVYGNKLISEICANNHAQSGDLSVSYWGWYKTERVLDNSAYAHTIVGTDIEL